MKKLHMVKCISFNNIKIKMKQFKQSGIYTGYIILVFCEAIVSDACGKVLWVHVYMVLCQTFIHAVSHCKFHSLLLICTWINVYENIAALGLYDRIRVFCCCSCQSTLIGFNK